MLESLNLLFDTSDFPARWYCGHWTTLHGLVHIVSDFAIAGAYAAIPLTLAYFIYRRKNAPFLPLLWLFVAFILSCGIGHFAEAVIFWHPWYRFSAMIKACTAIVSWATVIALLPVIPKALALPHLAAMNAKLSNYAMELEYKNRELDQFAYIASHDLKEPLRGVRNLSNWITKDLGEQNLPADTRRHLSQMLDQIDRMDQLLDGLLSYSRAGREANQPVMVNLGKMVRNIVKLFDRPERFQVVVEDPMPTVVAASTPLETCIRNLVSNAIKHHDREDGMVRISARVSGRFVEVRVVDDGPGIAPDHRERIFEIFQTLRPRENNSSTGLGLALVKKIVETHGGTINVSSAPSGGAEFTVRWPRANVRK